MTMRAMMAGLAVLAVLAPVAAAAQVEGHGSPVSSGSFDDIRGEEKVRAPEPLARRVYEAAVAQIFAAADTNRDGSVTLAEFQAIIGARKEQAIQERFAAIDTDRNKSVSYAEFSAWQRALGSLVLAEDAGGAGGAGQVAELIRYQPGRSRDSEVIAGLLEPLGATVITAANTDYDGGTSLAELTAYEDKRFDALDANKDGWLTDDELRARRSAPGGARTGG
jgi:Ca2+-binding EF-hand superfamily protein